MTPKDWCDGFSEGEMPKDAGERAWVANGNAGTLNRGNGRHNTAAPCAPTEDAIATALQKSTNTCFVSAIRGRFGSNGMGSVGSRIRQSEHLTLHGR